MFHVEYYFQDKPSSDIKDHACFYLLRSIQCDLVKYYPKLAVSGKVADFWVKTLKEWGFQFENTEDFRQFSVKCSNNYIATVNLIFIRYLDIKEHNLHKVIESLYNFCKENPEFDKWAAFQCIHYFIYYQTYFNHNHTLLDHSTKPLISLKTFWENVKKLSKTAFYFGQFNDAMGSDRLNSLEIKNLLSKKKHDNEDVIQLAKLLS